MKFLTKEEIDQFTTEQAENQLKKLALTYKLEKPLNECFVEVWGDLDRIVNNLLWLEDRIAKIKVVDHLNSIRHTKDHDETTT
jgi:hypothetical protein